jgi:hypothetical protein
VAFSGGFQRRLSSAASDEKEVSSRGTHYKKKQEQLHLKITNAKVTTKGNISTD